MVERTRLLASVLTVMSLVAAGDATADSQFLYGPYFVADATHTSRLLVHNKRHDHAVEARVYALPGSGEQLLLATIALKAKESRTLAIDEALLQRKGRPALDGGILIEYDFFEAQPLDARILVQHRNGSGYVVPVLRRNQIRGTIQEAAFLLPGSASRAFVAVQNTADTPRRVTVQLEPSHQSVATLTIPSRTSIAVALDAALAKAGARDAAVVRITNDGNAGDVTATGAVVDGRRRYAARIRFNDVAHGEHARVLRAQFLLLGPQDAALGLPAGTNFTARCVLRNPTEQPKTARPRVKWLSGPETRSAELPPVHLQPNEVRVIDLAAAQQRGEIPPDFHFGTFEVPYAGESGHVFAQLISSDSGSGLTLDDWMTSHESHAVAGLEWLATAEQQTLISITNAGPRADTFTIQLFSGGNTIDLPPLDLPSGAIALLNMREIATAHPDLTSGSFSVRGAFGTRSAFRLERMVIDGIYVSSTAGSQSSDSPVMYVDVDGDERVLWIRTDTSAVPGSDAFPPEETTVTLDLSTVARWSSGTATTNETDTTEYVTLDTETLTIKPPPAPQVSIFVTIYRPPSIAELVARFYDPCANNYLLTYSLRFSTARSSYQLTRDHWPFCEYRPVCFGTCTVQSYTTVRGNADPCVHPWAPFVVCLGLVVNGRCVAPHLVCHHATSPSSCT